MGEYKPIETKYTKEKANVIIRLNKKDTIFLLSRINEALLKDTGANIIMLNLRGAFSITYSEERDEQLKIIAFKGQESLTVASEQRGYNGEWSHIEVAFPVTCCDEFRSFLGVPHNGDGKDVEKQIISLDNWM